MKSIQFGAINDGEMLLNELGEIVHVEWQQMARVRTNVELDLFAVMPNHFHGLVIIHDGQRSDSSRSILGSAGNRSRTLQSASLGAILGQFKLAVIRRAKSSQFYSGGRIWQRNYHEHIVRSEDSLNDIRRYICENPARWQDDSLYVE